MKKSTKIRIASLIVFLTPVLAGAIYCAPLIVQRWDKCLSFAGIVVAIIIFVAFKDAAKRFLSTPTLLKTSIICVIISLLAVSLGQDLLILSACALAGALLSLPFVIWYNMEIRPPTNKEVMEQFKELKGKIDDNID